MTKKNAKKVAARARKGIHGGRYQHHLRLVGGGGSPLEPIIRELIVLAVARRREEEANHPPNASILYTGDQLIAEYRRPHPARDALRSALIKLDLSTLRKIEAVMYAGREDDDVLLLYRELGRDDQLVTASMIASKVQLDEYLSDGLRLAREQGVDLDAFWRPREDAD